MKDAIKSILAVVFVILSAFGLFLKFRDDRQYDQASAHIPPASRAIESGNYYQALAELKEIGRPNETILTAMAYCIYKTEGKSAAISTIKDYLAKNDVNENRRQFLMRLIEDISSDNISSFTLHYTTHKDSRKEKIEFGVRYR